LGSLDRQGASRIGSLADPILQALPFAALYDGRQFLVEQLPVSYLSRDFAPPPPSRGELLAMGASEFSGEGEPPFPMPPAKLKGQYPSSAAMSWSTASSPRAIRNVNIYCDIRNKLKVTHPIENLAPEKPNFPPSILNYFNHSQ
jgi:hypothetical protein